MACPTTAPTATCAGKTSSPRSTSSSPPGACAPPAAATPSSRSPHDSAAPRLTPRAPPRGRRSSPGGGVTERLRVGVLASGAGSNLQAILDRVHGKDADVVAVGSDKPGAPALARAAALDVPTHAFPAGEFADREARDAA